MLADDARGTLRAAARAIRALATSRQGEPAVSPPSSTVEANRNPGSNSTPQREDPIVCQRCGAKNWDATAAKTHARWCEPQREEDR